MGFLGEQLQFWFYLIYVSACDCPEEEQSVGKVLSRRWRPTCCLRCGGSRWLVYSWSLGFVLAWLGMAGGAGTTAPADEASPRPRIESAWDKIEAARGTEVKPVSEVPAASG
jgi:hypothetical protein